LALFGDGLVSLFIPGGYLNLQFYYIMQYQNSYALQIVITAAWNQW